MFTLLDRYVDTFHRYDVDSLVALLAEDASFSMPPYTLWLRGGDSVRAWLLGPGSVCRGSRSSLGPITRRALPRANRTNRATASPMSG